jgi:osmotically inducible protein OsmC
MNLIMRTASARWSGAQGSDAAVTFESGIIKQIKISSGSSTVPVKDGLDTLPVELIAAAYASSFSLALSDELGLKGLAAGETTTTVTLTMEHAALGWTIKNIHLNVVAKLPKITQGKFIDATVRAKTNCLISQLLRNNISMNAKLEK